MKTILFTYTFPFNPERGGIERVNDLLTKSLIERGYKVLHLCLHYPDNYRGYDYPTDITTLPSSDINSDENYTFYKEFIKNNNVDIVVNSAHVNNYKLFLTTLPNNVKKITTIHSKPSLSSNSIYRRRNNKLSELFIHTIKIVSLYLFFKKKVYLNRRAKSLQYISENSDIVCLLSEKYRDDFKRLVPSIPNNKLTAIPNPNTYPRQELTREKRKQILYVGRLDMGEKQFDRVVAVWKRVYKKLPDWEMIFVGDGADRGYFDKITRNLDRIKCVGYKDPKPYYEEASILALTSNNEGFPMVLAEAMVHGVVPICFNSFESASDIIDNDRSGLLITPYSLKEYSEKLINLLNNSEKLKNLANFAKVSIESYNIQNISDQWEKLFNRNL